MLNLKTITATCILAAGATLTALPAQAAVNIEDTVTSRIKVADLQTEAGLTKTYARLAAEAREQCTFVMTGSRIARVDSECAANLLDDFVDTSGVPALTRIHQDKTVG